MSGSMECKNASNESLRESVEVNKELDVVRGALADKLAVCVESVSSSYIIESVGVKRKDGAAKRSPPVANFLALLLESLLVDVHTFCLAHCVKVLELVCCALLTTVEAVDLIIFIVDFILLCIWEVIMKVYPSYCLLAGVSYYIMQVNAAFASK
jgi:hypothetical protein